jgi:hypothetical protein
MDGIRDLLLSPVSLIAALAGILTNHPDPSRFFNRLLQIGHRSDKWINLFDTHNKESDALTADDFVRKAESIVLSELEKARVTPRPKQEAGKPESPLPQDPSAVDQDPKPH